MELIKQVNDVSNKTNIEIDGFITEMTSMMDMIDERPSIGISKLKEEAPTTGLEKATPKIKDVLIYMDQGNMKGYVITNLNDKIVTAKNPKTNNTVTVKRDGLAVAMKSKTAKVKQTAGKLGTKFPASRIWVYGDTGSG